MKRDLHIVSFDSLDDIPYDPKCSIKKDSIVVKVNTTEGQLHSDGSKGKTVGGIINEKGIEYYLVKFDKQRINKDNLKNLSALDQPIDDILIQIKGDDLKVVF